MKLRAKVALTLAAAVLPVAAVVYYAGARYVEHMEVEGLEEVALTQHEFFAERCERTARRRRFRPRRRRVRFYDQDLRPQHGAPPLEEELRAGLQNADVASFVRSRPRRSERILAKRVGEGPCAVVVVSRPTRTRGIVDALFALLPALAAALATLLAAGPVVRRIRRLRSAVESSGHIEQPGADEIAELSRVIAKDRSALQDQVTLLAERDATLSRYIANTMHDVMTPLTVMQGHLRTLERRLLSDSPGELKDALQESHYIVSLLQNLAAAARLEGAIESTKSEVDLGDIVERVIARHAPIAELRDIEINFSLPEQRVCIHADATLVEQALSNLVHNAVRYGRAGGHVAVLLSEADGRFRVEVLDDGPGVDAAMLKKLSRRRFRSEEARTRHPDGQGLGLSIASDVAELHGMELGFEIADADAPFPGLRVVLAGDLGLAPSGD